MSIYDLTLCIGMYHYYQWKCQRGISSKLVVNCSRSSQNGEQFESQNNSLQLNQQLGFTSIILQLIFLNPNSSFVRSYIGALQCSFYGRTILLNSSNFQAQMKLPASVSLYFPSFPKREARLDPCQESPHSWVVQSLIRDNSVPLSPEVRLLAKLFGCGCSPITQRLNLFRTKKDIQDPRSNVEDTSNLNKQSSEVNQLCFKQ